MPKINSFFKSIIPALTPIEYDQLEKNIIDYGGAREKIILWNDFIIDGHNRFEICTKHNLPFEKTSREFKDESEAGEWIILNQFGRRNLNKFQRSRIAIRLECIYLERAEANKSAAAIASNKARGKNPDNPILEKPEIVPVNTNKELARLADVSTGTLAKVLVIEREASPELRQQLEDKVISINRAYEKIRPTNKKGPAEKLEYIKKHTPVYNAHIIECLENGSRDLDKEYQWAKQNHAKERKLERQVNISRDLAIQQFNKDLDVKTRDILESLVLTKDQWLSVSRWISDVKQKG